MENIKTYYENFTTVGIIGFFVILIAIYFLRTPLKAILSGSLGYRSVLDDYSFSINKNKEIIYKNELARMKTGLNIKNGFLIIGSILSTLIHPVLFAVIFLKYKYSLIKEKISKINDYSIYDDMDTEDKFVNFLNVKSAKINLAVDELIYTSYILMGIGIYLNNFVVAIAGIIIIATIQFITIGLLYNAYMYRINYKFVDFYRIMRLLNSSSLGGNKSLFILGLISFISNYTGMAGFSVFAWSIFAVRVFITLTISSILKREAFVNHKHQMIENRDYTNIENIASYPNPISQSRGFKFTTALQMKFFELEKKASGKNLLHIDNYSFFPQIVNKTDLRKNPLMNKTLSNSVKVYFEALDITKQIIVLGGMGSGKTEMINYFVEQVIKDDFKHFKAIAYNDSKGDFSKNFYREDKDILVNLYDIRASVWCPFLEMKHNIESGTSFINNLFSSLQGDEKDFFIASSKQKTAIWLQEAYFSTDNNINAWDFFFKKIKEFEDEIRLRDDRTESGVLSNIKIVLEILMIMYYQIVLEKRKTFTFYDFVNTENIQLFLVNNKQYEAKLTPYLNGLTATYINTIMGKNDTKEHLILNLFDEFLTMKIDEATRKTLLTATRSKGFCNILLSQYLVNDEKLIQDIDSSRYALITFNINDDFTLEKVSKKLGEAEYLAASSSVSETEANSTGKNLGDDGKAGDMSVSLGFVGDIFKNFNKKDKLSYSLSNTKVVIEQQLQSMPKYHHLTFIPSEETKMLSSYDAKRFFKLMVFGYDKLMGNIAKNNDFLAKESGILYLGYTPQSTYSLNNDSFKAWDMKKYYLFNLKKQELKKDDLITSFDDEKEEFKHYMNIKFAGTVEAAKDYIRQNNLERYDIDNMFKNVEENNDKVQKLLSKYSEQQRYDLMEDFFKIDETDLESKYNFCKENDLIGCILGIFTFSKEFRETVLGEFEDDK